MESRHRVVTGDARSLDVADDSVELVVTSPPYPMIEMWDDAFSAMDPAVGEALAAGDAAAAFELMHDVLEEVWAEIARVLAPGGIACVNVGDATRTLGDRFRCYPNHAEITTRLRDRGLDPLPDILWRKPANSAAKFMGSGMVPPNAYPTLEHEHLLVFRNGARRSFPAGDDRRYESAYFWEERNEWFSDLWAVRGERQTLDTGLRERSGAFPVAVPYRLISMFSVNGDTVLDPFMGTGTTTVAAAIAARNSIGYEREESLRRALDDRMDEIPAKSRAVLAGRLEDHEEWARRREREGDPPGYEADHYDVPVMTKQERRIRLYAVETVEAIEEGFRASHVPIEETAAVDTAPAGTEGA
jgi:site-specific DNA-methyltransferase (cytosine-N4-specific)